MEKEIQETPKEIITASSEDLTNQINKTSSSISSRRILEHEDRDDTMLLEQFFHPNLDEDPDLGKTEY